MKNLKQQTVRLIVFMWVIVFITLIISIWINFWLLLVMLAIFVIISNYMVKHEEEFEVFFDKLKD